VLFIGTTIAAATAFGRCLADILMRILAKHSNLITGLDRL
jgi:hypothetical protein